MILSFKEQFKEPILSGRKIHTIRNVGRWRVGAAIQFATGVRTKNYEQFHSGTCKGVQDIEIKYTDMRGAVEIYIDGKHYGTWHRFIPEKSVNVAVITTLAINEGFDGVKEFLEWFNRDYKGDLVHWTDFKY
ncbi:MAG TPA: hypothetical protein GXZ87_07565 [Bacteroidales bacterium]|nr:hypothetical protein [Bacteroidales bacterium]